MPLQTGEIEATVGTTAAASRLPKPCYCVSLRSPLSNTDTIYVSLGKVSATTGSMRIEPGEIRTINITNAVILKKLLGHKISDEDFLEVISYISETASQTLYIDGLAL